LVQVSVGTRMLLLVEPDGIGNHVAIGAVSRYFDIGGRASVEIADAQQVPRISVLTLIYRHRGPAAGTVNVNGCVGRSIVARCVVDMDLIVAAIIAGCMGAGLPVADLPVLTVIIVYDDLSRRRGSRRRLFLACIRVFSYECGLDPFGVQVKVGECDQYKTVNMIHEVFAHPRRVGPDRYPYGFAT